SGERVWPFPMDEDFDQLLRSDIADIKQCAVDSHGDHVLAARFLSRFVPKSIAWVHVDLSAGEHKGGLAHVPTDMTGFGVRLTVELLHGRQPSELVEAMAGRWAEAASIRRRSGRKASSRTGTRRAPPRSRSGSEASCRSSSTSRPAVSTPRRTRCSRSRPSSCA